ncbi:hypothetical protein Emed_001914 [Eimeria media]
MFEPIYDSHFNTCGGEQVMLGIDEAGRGCVLGALVYACFFCPSSALQKLEALKVDDSKKLSEEQREAAFEAIRNQKDSFGWRIHSISPQEISAKMLRKRKVSLNDISHDAAADLIASVCKEGVLVSEVYVDTVGKADQYEKKLQRLFPSIKITVREKADSLFPVVSAASILAKVTRDRALRLWPAPPRPLKKRREEATQKKLKTNPTDNTVEAETPENTAQEEETETSVNPIYGSGYPGDRVTIAFLRDYMDPVFGFPEIVRWSWQTAKEMFEKEGTETNWYDEVEDEEEEQPSAESRPAKQSRITSFFQAKPKTGAQVDRPRCFIRNRIELITSAARL